MGSDLEDGLRVAANEKQRVELVELEKQRKESEARGEKSSENHVIMMIGNGFGVIQIMAGLINRDFVAETLIIGSGDDREEGTACRINGKMPILKGNEGRLTIYLGKALSLGNIVARFDGINSRDFLVAFNFF